MQLSSEVLSEIVSRVIEELKKEEACGIRQKDPSGIINVKAATVRPQPFNTGKQGDKVFLTDILTLEESPRIGCGIMEMDQSKFEWILTYDEVDYIIDGCLEIIIDGRIVRAEKGDVLFIPKDSHIEFSAPEYARFMYVVYPANWQEQ